MSLRTVNVTRYITPLREGGSLPALADADDGFKYVIKFHGSGHGPKALIAELIGGMVAQRLKLRVPELVFVQLDEAFGRTEGDEEIQDLLRASRGLNLGLHFLSGALTYDPVTSLVDGPMASMIVWLDAFLTNVDRTVRNTNMLMWHRELWLIDHGSTLYFHHTWTNWEKQALNPFPLIKDHVLLRFADRLAETSNAAKDLITPSFIREMVDTIPDEWASVAEQGLTADEVREVYFRFLTIRLENSDNFLNEAVHARETLI